MRRFLILLPALLLGGCFKQSTSYYIGDSDHALTVRAEQRYLWDDEVEVKLVASNMPQCQRQFPLTELPVDELTLELFTPGDNVYTVRAGTRLWQVDTTNCTQLAAPAPNALGQPVGVFQLNDEEKMVFEAAAPATAPQ